MKRNNFFLISLLLVIAFAFVACNLAGDIDELRDKAKGGLPHTHTYSPTWWSNGTQHWKECSCGDKTEVANHSPADGVCTICGYDNTTLVMEMVSIQTGTLTWPSAVITLSAFKMGKYEVTQEQYNAVMSTNPSFFSSNPEGTEDQGKRPVESVTWFDAVEFCNKLSVREGLTPVYTITDRTPGTGYPITAATVTANWEANGYCLPTEAQWEYACRAESTSDYWCFGSTEANLVNYAWYSANSDSKTHEVGKKTANAWGLHDMHGNVWEWCWDLNGTLPSTNQNDYKGADSGVVRVIRGGSKGILAEGTRSAARSSNNPYGMSDDIGFRVVRPEYDSHTHDFSGEWFMDATHHWKVCLVNAAEEGLKAAHSPADGVCTTCGYDNTPAHTHDWNWETYTSGLRQCQSGTCTVKAGVGDTGPAGGIIIYVAASGFTVTGTGGFNAYYLEAAPAANQISSIIWCSCTGSPWCNVTTSTEIGTGKANTAAIIAAHLSDTTTDNAAKAASITIGGKSDWFLPSKDELNEMYKARSYLGISSGYFWSSLQYDFNNNAWAQGFDNGYQNHASKNCADYAVLAVRAF